MSGTKTAEGVLAQYIEAMGQELGQLLNATSDELTASVKFSQFREYL